MSAQHTRSILDAAMAMGFAGAAVCPVEPLRRGAAALRSWLDAGMHGEMAYMAGPVDRADPRALLEGARSLLVVALAHAAPAPHPPPAGRLTGVVARYARGADYHLVLKDKLRALADRCAEIAGRPVLARPCTDSAPLLEREAAHRAGLGFIAKNTLTILPGVGSYVLLGELLLDLDLEPGRAAEPRCGACRACLDACPTGAFVSERVLDARRCISYLTIELRGAIPRALRPSVGTHVFGCDICQEVCPFNARPKESVVAPELRPRPELEAPDLEVLLALGSSGYKRLVKGTALARASRNQLARNAAVALGNTGDRRAVPALREAVRAHPSPLVRAHAAWALGRIGGPEAEAALQIARGDPDPDVADEARRADDDA